MKAHRRQKRHAGKRVAGSRQAVSSRQPLRKRLARREKAPQLQGFTPRKACATGAFTEARSQQGRVNEFGFLGHFFLASLLFIIFPYSFPPKLIFALFFGKK
ncbi:MAG: hypothetical protein ONB46_17550 [candidate division KSB1 bacterium]|nr:hypothetical protein [candidate division KSB1 bacterium]MDZ7367590.1 hypothetical protein [candidate division KSB1 bacterium]MDZ7405382.1 hypothetical protein [candidate division KSB1 bacterium]